MSGPIVSVINDRAVLLLLFLHHAWLCYFCFSQDSNGLWYVAIENINYSTELSNHDGQVSVHWMYATQRYVVEEKEKCVKLNPNSIHKTKEPFKISTIYNNIHNAEEASRVLAIPNQISDNLQALDEKVKSMIEKGQKMIPNGKQTANGTPMQKTSSICKVCGKEGRWNQIRDHIESNHLEGVSIPCDHCGKTLSTRLSLCKHKSRFHK